ncbi:zf-TFIIB domain-containing protein [Candidatus Woesearchaeota archaeon]|nr:zf-TFIIB domain-containing protein [Candidatus Woesearchaeota archaeon]
MDCPRCNVKMNKIRKHDVVIDVCPGCKGMWLDDKEIEKLASYAKGGKDGKKRK